MFAGRIKLAYFRWMVGIGALGLGAGVLFWAQSSDSDEMPPEHRLAPVTTQPTTTQPAVAGLPPAAPAAPQAAASDRPWDTKLLALAGTDLGTKKRKDITGGKPYKVNVYQDDGNATVNRAKVDMDRDDQWDEKWTFDGTDVSRKVSPSDDEDYSEVYVWDGTDWQPQ